MPSPSTRSVSRSKGIRSRSYPACCPAAAWDIASAMGRARSPSPPTARSSISPVRPCAHTRAWAFSIGWVARFPHITRRGLRRPRFSPDGAYRAPDGRRQDQQLYVLNVDRQHMTKVTFDGAYNGLPVWSPDGQQLAYFSDRVSGGINVFLGRSDGAGEPDALTTGDGIKIPTSFSPDGRLLLVMQAEQGSAAGRPDAASYDVAVLSLGDRQLTPFAATPASELAPAFSPDGKWVAYQQFESGMERLRAPISRSRWPVPDFGRRGSRAPLDKTRT